MKVLENKENFLANRKEVKIVVEAEKNPGFEDAVELLSGQFKADKEAIVINHIKGKFGRNTFLISACIYKNKEEKEKFEPKPKMKKGQAAPVSAETAPAQQAAQASQASQSQPAPAVQPAQAEKK